MRSGRTAVAAAIVTTVLVVGACAGEAGDGTEGPEPTTTERPTSTTTTEATTTTTAPPGGPTEGDLAACEPYGELIAVWGTPETDPAQLQTAVQTVLDEAWQADDPDLIAALERLRTGVNSLDVEATGNAAIAYSQRCTALGAPL